MSLLRIENLQLRLGGREILEGVDFQMEAGSFHLVIGPNGAGKSSMLKCLLSIFRSHEGRIWIDGRPNHQLTARERARIMAYVPQVLDMSFNLDVWSFMELSRFAHDEEPLKVREALIEASLARTESLAFKDAYLDELSGGERQRVLLAAALAQQPRLLILDEPSHSLDPAHKVDLVKLLSQLYETENMAILLVTHDWNEFLHLNPEILALKAGRVAFQCEAGQLESHLESLFDCAFHHVAAAGQRISIPQYR